MCDVMCTDSYRNARESSPLVLSNKEEHMEVDIEQERHRILCESCCAPLLLLLLSFSRSLTLFQRAFCKHYRCVFGALTAVHVCMCVCISSGSDIGVRAGSTAAGSLSARVGGVHPAITTRTWTHTGHFCAHGSQQAQRGRSVLPRLGMVREIRFQKHSVAIPNR